MRTICVSTLLSALLVLSLPHEAFAKSLRLFSCMEKWSYGYSDAAMYPPDHYVMEAFFSDHTTLPPYRVDLHVVGTTDRLHPALTGTVVNQTYNLTLAVPMDKIGALPASATHVMEIALEFGEVPTTNPDVDQRLHSFSIGDTSTKCK